MLLNEELQQACENGEIEKVQSLLDRGVDVDAKNNKGKTPLCLAINRGHTGIAKLLIENRANVNVQGYYDQTALHLAAQKGYEDIVKLLLQNKANVNDKGRFHCDKTALHFAAEKGYEDIVELLLQNKANVNDKDSNGYAPLHFAAKEGHIEIVKLLLKNEANINVIDRFGYTPLHFAAEKGDIDIEIVKLLLKNEANVNIKSDHGFFYPILEGKGSTPLQTATSMEVLFLLLLYGAEKDRQKINEKPELANCLAEFERIERMPHLGRLIKSYKKGNKKVISKYIDSEENQKALTQEFKTVKERCTNKQLSFISEYLCDFVEHMVLTNNSFKIEVVQKFLNAPNNGFEEVFNSKKLSAMAPVMEKIASYLNSEDSILAISAEQLDLLKLVRY